VAEAPGFENFVDENYHEVRRGLALAFGDAQRAEELAQEAFARAWERWSELSEMERPRAWVYVVAVNQARRDIRRDARRREPMPRAHSQGRPPGHQQRISHAQPRRTQ
jgi:RNA polymerase sigma factor (sigma-70 family)